MPYTIEDFWKPLLSVPAPGAMPHAPEGWRCIEQGLPTFVEAPLSLGAGFGDRDPNESPVILVAAAGAVGKTTLAQQISFSTNAILVDLAKAGNVGANFLAGGLARTGKFTDFCNGDASLLVDGLDEARMRVNERSFNDFLEDVVMFLNQGKPRPIILFGRTGSVEETWILLSDKNIESPVLEIGYYDEQDARTFARVQVRALRRESVERQPDSEAVDLLLTKLGEQFAKDRENFVGYSPVLMAVASQVAEHENPAQLIARINNGTFVPSLIGVSNDILSREQRKLGSVPFGDPNLKNILYGSEEQTIRIINILYPDFGMLPDFPDMNDVDKDIYNNFVKEFAGQHPFLDGRGDSPSNEVFGAYIAARALNIEGEKRQVLKALHSERR